MKTRLEKDSLGTKTVPADVYYGVETARAIENYPISGLRFHPAFIGALAVIKKSCALANMRLKRLDGKRGRAIVRACDEIMEGKLKDQFITDVLQSGAGVSAHMNANEVITNRALELMGKKKGDYEFLHSHDHVNMGQSTNDVIPTAIRLGALSLVAEFKLSSQALEKAFAGKAAEFKAVVKAGRTHMQDAAPITLGQEFSGYARQLEKARERILALSENLRELGIGGSAVGTGLNTTLEYRKQVIRFLREQSGLPVKSAKNLFEVMQSDADMAGLSGGLRNYALVLIQISNDLRLLSSGPKTGFAEIVLPARQPGSSIMPGKVNPVMAEVTAQVAFQVLGNDQAIAFAVNGGQLELNVMRPVIAHNLMQSLEILKNLCRVLRLYCIEGITADKGRCLHYAETSYGIAAALNPYIGYSKGAECVKESVKSGKTLRQVVLDKGYLGAQELDRILSPSNLTRPKIK
ncbi:MAG: aspartate ammonia-lyase [Omnitrophica bacterium GWA2_52_8]|nr:MAG: aspartate ammonia-lyase [Omnitrophica bacterium GWA2_52_8]